MPESFILQSYLPDISVCDDLINAHENNADKQIGAVTDFGKRLIDKAVKDSEESAVLGDMANIYLSQLDTVLLTYIAKYPQCNAYNPFKVVIPPQIQKYKPGGGFFPWHTERSNARNQEIASRHLVFMTYLNDVTDAGETEFALQNLKVQPRKGLTLIWPADWTHTHRGVASPTQEKYIVTGWFHFT
tara:strand:- start:66 stop:626 length:561 start_codon:yes stop_codon:yes gene_type:complete